MKRAIKKAAVIIRKARDQLNARDWCHGGAGTSRVVSTKRPKKRNTQSHIPSKNNRRQPTDDRLFLFFFLGFRQGAGKTKIGDPRGGWVVQSMKKGWGQFFSPIKSRGKTDIEIFVDFFGKWQKFSTWTFCKNIFVVFLNSPCRETPSLSRKKMRMVGGWVWDLANARGGLSFFLPAPRR
jgi:hypothetical protein